MLCVDDQIELILGSVGWSACRGLGCRAGDPAAGGLGMVTLLNEGDIMKKNGWVCLHQTSSVRFNLTRSTFKIVSAALWFV